MKDETTTPGPWYAVEYPNCFAIKTMDIPQGLHLFDFDDVDKETAEANAKLASQAPILKELVEKQDQLINKMSWVELDKHKSLVDEIIKLKSKLK